MFIQNLCLMGITALISISLLYIIINSTRSESAYKSWLCLCVSAVLCIFQYALIVDPISNIEKHTQSLSAIEWVFIVLSLISLMCIIYELSIYKKLPDNKKIFTVLISGFQVAIFMTVANLENVSSFIKVMSNFYYITIPALVLYEITESKEQKTS